jgi:hypothetical protein
MEWIVMVLVVAGALLLVDLQLQRDARARARADVGARYAKAEQVRAVVESDEAGTARLLRDVIE